MQNGSTLDFTIHDDIYTSIDFQRQGHSSSSPVLPQQRPQPSSTHFSRYDVQTTSYHLITSRIDLHLCDDSSPESGSGKCGSPSLCSSEHEYFLVL